MKASRIISITLFLLVLIFPTIITNAQPIDSLDNFTGSNRQAADGTLLLQLYVDKGSYNLGDNILLSGLLSLNGYPIADAQMCFQLWNDSGGELWGACNLTDNEGRFSETLTYGDIIPAGYTGYFVVSATGFYDEEETYSEMTLAYGLGGDDDDDGDLTLSLFTYDKVEFVQGDNITVGVDVSYNGQPLANAEVCTDVWGGGAYLYSACDYTDANGQVSFWLEYGVSIPTGYHGNLEVESGVEYNGIFAIQNIDVPYEEAPAADLPLELQLWGPLVPIQIGGWEEILIGGTVTSQGGDVNGATVIMVVAGQTFQTTTGLVDSGKFYYGWANDTFPAGDYVVQVTVSKPGYQSATGTIPFTVFGDDYDFAVVMDSIHPVYDPATNVPFPGTLTLGGTPVSDWIEIDITYPDGRVEAFSNLSDENGRFTHTQPSLMELGTYQLVVYYQSDRKQISPVYTFSVGAAITPTVTPSVPQPTQAPRKCEIIDVVYPSMVVVGDNVNVTGKVVCTQDKEEIIPQEGWNVTVGGTAPSQSPVNAPIVQTSGDGSFATTFTANVVYIQEIAIFAQDLEIKTRYARWFGPLSVVVGIEPEITISQTDYDQGEILEGTLTLNPSYPAENWDSGLEIFYQITGPVDGVAKQYLFESQYYFVDPQYYIHNIVDRIYWAVPQDAGGGKYTLTAYISGHNIAAQTIETDFYVNDIQHTNLTAEVESDPEGWTSATLVGQFTDFNGVPIPDADVRVEFFIIQWNDDGSEIIGTREFKLTDTTNEFGSYEINLEPLDLFVGQGQDDPWEPYWATTTVYADKEGYATGAAILDIRVPTVTARMEIISVNPPLDYLSEMAQSGLSYEQLTDMSIQVRVRYNNIFVEGAKLSISAQGNWTVNCSEGADDIVTYEPYLSINGEQKEKWEVYSGDYWGVRQNTISWYILGYHHVPFYYYPKHSATMPAQHGMAQESTFTVSGRLFGYRYSENSPNQCGNQAYGTDSPAVPPPWVGAQPAVNIGVSLGGSSAGVVYNIAPPSISASGSAWVSPTGGEFKGKLNVGQATGFALHNHQVNLSIVAVDFGATTVSTETEKTTSGIVIEASAITDDKGALKLPLTAKTNPCELEEKAKYYVKITSPALHGNQYIPIELRCVKELKFELSDANISVIQAIDLTDNNPIQLAAGKETGVRVYLEVDGEIFQTENSPVQFDVKFELLAGANNTPLFPQIKTVSLSEKGASVSWSSKDTAINDAGIGEVAKFKDKQSGGSGRELIYVDFVFTPYQLSGSNTKFQIKITVDPNEVYGEAVNAIKTGITVKEMQRLQILFVPVDLNPIPMSLIQRQIKFLSQAYPLGVGDVGWGIAKNFPSAEMNRKFDVSRDTLSWLGQIALNIGERYNASGDTNVSYHIVGVVANDTWMDNQASADALEASGAHFGNGVSLIRDWNQQVEYTLAHEIGHGLGLYQSTVWSSVSKVYLGGKGSEQYDLHIPAGIEVHGLILKNGQIYDIAGDFDDKTNSQWRTGFGPNHDGSIQVVDLMGNAEGKIGGFLRMAWVYKDTYSHLFGKLKDPPGQSILVVQGGVMEDFSMQFSPIWQMSGLPDDMSEEGEYALELISSGNEILYTTRFSIYYGEPDSAPIFSLKVPFVPGTASLVISDESQVVAEIIRSSYSPEVQIVNQPVFVDETSVSISWTGTDLDNDALTYSLHYQCDDPTFWFVLAADLTKTNYSIDITGLPGSESCKIRVMASDGFTTAETISEPFSVQAKVPEVQILNEETAFPAGVQVFLHGAALDLEDGILPNESLRWFSDIDGELGVGSTIAVILSPGEHILTLRAQDSAGNFSIVEATIQAQVQDENILTGMGSGLQSLWLIACCLVLVAMMGIGVILIFMLALRNRNKPTPTQPAPTQQDTIQDSQGRWWYQDINTGGWYIWNGQAWQPVSAAVPNIAALQQEPEKKQRSGGACLLSLLISGIIGLIVVGGISLVAFNFFPDFQVEIGQGDITQILKMGGGGLLVTILGLLLLNGGFKAVITRRAIVEDEWGRQREKRGCGAILNGLGRLFFGVVCLVGGLGLMTLALYQEILPWLGF